MSFLTVGSGGGAVVVPVNKFTEAEVFRVGDQKRAVDATLRSDVSITKRRFDVVSLMTSTNLAALEALVGLDAEQPVVGDALRNGLATLTCQIRFLTRPYEHDTLVAEGFQVEATMRFEQV